jgi:hypothetical protein
MISAEPKICARCRHWQQIWQGPVDDWEEPGSCTGMTESKWQGMWTKASDGCENWQLSPARAHVEIGPPADWTKVEPMPDDAEIPF